MLHCRLQQETDVALQATKRDVMVHCRLEQETAVALQARTTP